MKITAAWPKKSPCAISTRRTCRNRRAKHTFRRMELLYDIWSIDGYDK